MYSKTQNLHFSHNYEVGAHAQVCTTINKANTNTHTPLYMPLFWEPYG